MKVLEQLMTKTMTNTYVVIFFVGFTFRSLLSFQIYIYIYIYSSLAECNEDSYLVILHLSRVELHCKLQEK